MARRSLKEYVKGLRKQVEDEQATLASMRMIRDKEVARLNGDVATQTAKVDALQGVVEQMTPAVTSRKSGKNV